MRHNYDPVSYPPAPPHWTSDAACAEVEVDLWFPERGANPHSARAVCARCLVSDECLAYAIANDIRHGVWGGTTWPERRKMIRDAQRPPVVTPRAA